MKKNMNEMVYMTLENKNKLISSDQSQTEHVSLTETVEN